MANSRQKNASRNQGAVKSAPYGPLQKGSLYPSKRVILTEVKKEHRFRGALFTKA
jgi:hypothetical protein